MRVHPQKPHQPPAQLAQAPSTTPSLPTEVKDDDDSATATLIWAQLLIPGRGDPINNGAIAVRDGKIEWVGSFTERPTRYHDIRPTYVPVLMPGLWDCHTHYMGVEVAAGIVGYNYRPGTNALIGAITVADLKATLLAGYTSVRELGGGYAGDLVPAIEGGHILGPNVYSAHAVLSITGGHGDDFDQPITTVLEAMHHGGAPLAICDGVDECIKTVRLMIRRGARVIKLCSSGGVLSLDDDPNDRQFSDAELSAIVQEAGRCRRAVAAHAIGKAGIMAALHAGVRSIEHGMYLDEEVAELMKEKGAYFVATQHIVRTLADSYLDTLPPKVRNKVIELVELSKSAYKIAIKSGVKIALGTDMISSRRDSKLSHGNNAYELVWAVEAGMTPLQAIESATANGPETLGRMAPLSGQLKEGYDADFIAVKTSPLENIRVLTAQDNITHVWKGGKLFKEP